MFKIEQPGIFTDVPAADYFRDPTPSPSLTQSVAKILLEKSPLHAWHAHPRLNPDYQHDDATKYDVGNISHKLMLGRGKEIVVLDGIEDWRTKAAKDQREAAAADGQLAVLGRHFAKADAMVRAAREQLDLRGLRDLFRKGDGEVVLAWKEGDIWLRQMVDWLDPARVSFADYKTTDMSVAPHCLGRMMVNAGWPIQAAMADRGLRALLPRAPRAFFFIVQETEKPYALNVVEMSADAMTMGNKQLDFAVAIWRRSIETNRWPGYPPDVVIPEYPGWHEQQFLDREIKEASRARGPSDLLMAG